MKSGEWDARYASEELVWSASPNVFLVEEADDMAPGKALDLACGEGRNALWLAERGFDVTGVDFSAVGLEKAGRLAEARGVRLHLVEADVVEWQPEHGGLDLVVVMYLHLVEADRRLVMRKAAGVLAPGGVLLVVGHDTTNITDGVGGPQDPAVLFTPEDVVADLTTDGAPPDLRVVRAERVTRPVTTEPGEPESLAIDALVRIERAGGG